jgi:hypothetical protein
VITTTGLAPAVGPGWISTEPQKKAECATPARHFKKVDRDLCWSSEMRFRFIEDRRTDYPVTILCDVLGVSRAGYYA